MIVNTALKAVAPFVPVAGTNGFARTCVKVYNATSPTKALVAGEFQVLFEIIQTYSSNPFFGTQKY